MKPKRQNPRYFMKRLAAVVSFFALISGAANAQVYINEMMANAPGADSSGTTGNEYFELRGTPGLSLAGYYLLSIEGQGTTGRGDINQFFDLGAFSIGANGFLFAQQNFSGYTPVTVGASVLQNTVGQGWGTVPTGTAGYSTDGTGVDMENSATTILLINRGIGIVPTLTTDVDTDDDGLLDLPAGWSVVDSVGLMDGVSGAVTDFSYGSITFRVGGAGVSAYGNVIDVPGTGTALYVGRKGDTTGSTTDDWFGAIVAGSAASPLAFNFTGVSDPIYAGKLIPDMVFGGTNPVPEPGTFSLAALGVFALWRLRQRGPGVTVI